MTDREMLIYLLKQADKEINTICTSSYRCTKCPVGVDGGCTRGIMADYLLANGVMVKPPKKPRPEPDLTGKCGSCCHAASTDHYGGSKCYVECTLESHLKKYCKNGRYTAIRARTTKGCKKYAPKEG